MKPVCVPCKLFYSPEKTGTYFEEGMPSGKGVRGTIWEPYKLWVGDKWKCRGCGSEIIIGVPTHPLAEQHQRDYETQRARFDVELRVDDC